MRSTPCSLGVNDAHAQRQAQSREAALAVCKYLDETMDDARYYMNGSAVCYDLDYAVRPHIARLQENRPSKSLPGDGQKLWQVLEGTIDAYLRPAGSLQPGWMALSAAVCDFKSWLITQYGLDITSLPDPGDWDRRIQCNVPGRTVTLDGLTYSLPTPKHARLIWELIQSSKDIHVIAQKELRVKMYGKYEGNDKSIARLIDELPEPLRRLIVTRRGEGTWLCLPHRP